MENVFIATENSTRFNDICRELEDPMSKIGPSLAMVTGPAGRGKSEAAKKYAAKTDAIYIKPMTVRGPLMLLQEITFELEMVKPGRISGCMDVVESAMDKMRRIIIVDEADLIPIKLLEMLRNMNENCSCPVVLIGEENLKRMIGSRDRLNSRIRRRMEFSPVAQADVALFFRKALLQEIPPEHVSKIQRVARGDWRPVLAMAANIERLMETNGLSQATSSLIEEAVQSYENENSKNSKDRSR